MSFHDDEHANLIVFGLITPESPAILSQSSWIDVRWKMSSKHVGRFFAEVRNISLPLRPV